METKGFHFENTYVTSSLRHARRPPFVKVGAGAHSTYLHALRAMCALVSTSVIGNGAVDLGRRYSGANQLQAALSAGLGCASATQGPDSHSNGATVLASYFEPNTLRPWGFVSALQ